MKKYLVINFNSKVFIPIAENMSVLQQDVLEIILEYNGQTLYNTNIIREAVNSFSPNVIFSFGWWQGNIDLIQYRDIIENSKAIHIYWTIDDPVYFDLLSLPFLEFTTFIFTSDGDILEKYKSRGVDAEFLPLACDPNYHRKVVTLPKDNIVLLANNYNDLNEIPLPYRIIGITNILAPLINGRYNIKVYGLWWQSPNRLFQLDVKFYGGNIPPNQIENIYSSAKIALGLISIGSSSNMLSMRIFEALGCGILYLTQYSPAIENFFENKKHLLWSKSPEETTEIVDYYLANPSERIKIALEGQQFVYNNHTYRQRVEKIISTVEKM